MVWVIVTCAKDWTEASGTPGEEEIEGPLGILKLFGGNAGEVSGRGQERLFCFREPMFLSSYCAAEALHTLIFPSIRARAGSSTSKLENRRRPDRMLELSALHRDSSSRNNRYTSVLSSADRTPANGVTWRSSRPQELGSMRACTNSGRGRSRSTAHSRKSCSASGWLFRISDRVARARANAASGSRSRRR